MRKGLVFFLLLHSLLHGRSFSQATTKFLVNTATALPTSNGKALEIDFDFNGNLYINGGTSTMGQVAKFGPTGNFLWTFSGNIPAQGWRYGNNWGGWTVDKTTGEVYVGQGSSGFGCSIVRLNSTTGLFDGYRTPLFTDNQGNRGEIWKMRWSCVNGIPQIMIAGGSGGVGSYSDHIGVLSIASKTFYNYHVSGVTTSLNQDVSDFVIDPANDDLYCILSSGNTPYVNNRLYKNSFPYSVATQKWHTLSGYDVLKEDANTPYMPLNPNIGFSNVTNSLAVNRSNLFYYDGTNLKAFDKATGAGVGTPFTFAGSVPLMQQGIHVDECSNIFVGTANGIKVFRFNGSQFDDNAAPDIPITGSGSKTVYALRYDWTKQLLYVAGDGFIASFDISAYCNNAVIQPRYDLSINANCTSATASLSPVPQTGALITYTLLSGTNVIASNNTGIFTGLGLGKYTMKASIASCEYKEVSKEFSTTSLNFTANVRDVCGGINGSITLVPQNGIAPFSYSKDGNNFQPEDHFDGLSAGTYTVTVKDATGCSSSSTVVVASNDLYVKAGIINSPICEGTSTPLSSTSNGITFSWTPTAGLSNSSTLSPIASPSATTKYYLSTQKGNCSLTDSTIVTVRPAPIADAGKDDTVCFKTATQLHGQGGQTYSWGPSTYLDDPNVATPTVMSPAQSVTYSLRVTDANGCYSLLSDMVIITVTPETKVYLPSDTIIARNQPLQLNAIDINNSGFSRYEWSPSFGLNNPAIQNPMASINDNMAYSVTAYTASGCEGKAIINIKVYKGPDVYVPNAFTPNGDRKNDYLKMVAVGIKEVKSFEVFNRWGQRIFQTRNASLGWDGKINGLLQPSGTYIWTIEAVSYAGDIIRKKGTTLLIQ